MGYQVPRKTYVLQFADEDMQGLEVRAGSVPVRTFAGLVKLASAETAAAAAEDAEEIAKLFDAFAGALVSWNLTELDDGGEEIPVPATLEAVYNQDTDWMLRVAFAWLAAIGGVPAPLDGPSTSGGRSVELSLPMAPLSGSPES